MRPMDVNNILTIQSWHNYNLLKYIRAGVVKLVDALDLNNGRFSLYSTMLNTYDWN